MKSCQNCKHAKRLNDMSQIYTCEAYVNPNGEPQISVNVISAKVAVGTMPFICQEEGEWEAKDE